MNRLAYKKQRNYCVSLMCQNNKKHVSLNDNCITSNKNFWRVVKLRVVLRDGGKTISDT